MANIFAWETHYQWAKKKQEFGEDVGMPRSLSACPLATAMSELDNGCTWEVDGESARNICCPKIVELPIWMKNIATAVDHQHGGALSATKYVFLLEELHRFNKD